MAVAAHIDEALAATDLFGGLDASVRAELARHVEAAEVPGGTVLMTEGDAADAVWIVLEGRLGVFRDEVVIGEIGPGELVGEVGLLGDRPRGATVRTLRDSELLRVPADAFALLVDAQPQVMRRVSGTVIDRLHRRPTCEPGGRATTIVLVGDAGPDVPRRLTAALAAIGKARLVLRDDVDGEGVQDRLRRIEADHAYVVYDAGDGSSDWGARGLRQADRVVVAHRRRFVAAPQTSFAVPTPVAVPSGTPCVRVVVHPPTAAAPTGGGRGCHHIRIDRDADYARLARHLTGRAVGVVLGGGGARGLAHLGVVRALEEAGVPIDAVGGTSIGAIMGVAVAMGWDDETRVAHSLAAFVRTRRLIGVTLPLVAVSSGRRLTRLLRDYLGETAVEDLWLPFFCVSTSLSTGEPVVHDVGPAWRAVRASIALPGILPPVWDDGDLLVDGGVVDDLPVGVMRTRVAGPVIAVDLRPPPVTRVTPRFEPALSGWRVLADRVRSGPAAPRALDIVSRSRDIGVRQAQRARGLSDDADLCLRPPTEGYGMFDFKKAPELIELGYRSAVAQLEAAPFIPGASSPVTPRIDVMTS